MSRDTDKQHFSLDWTGNGNSVFKTLGASSHNKDGEREKNDYYATDPKAIDALLSVATIPKNVLEPACGEGHLSKRLEELGYNVISSDLIDRGYGQGGINFFETLSLPEGVSCIITNPPFKYATEFVVHAMELLPVGGLCCMFLRTLFLEGKERRKLIFDITPPKSVFVFSERIKCAKNGEFDLTGAAQSYSWYVWEKGYKGKTTISWI